VMGAFSALSGVALTVARIRPILEMAEPILKTEPESAENKAMVTRLSGTIELSNVSFRYRESMPYVIDGMSLKIKAGEYVGDAVWMLDGEEIARTPLYAAYEVQARKSERALPRWLRALLIKLKELL